MKNCSKCGKENDDAATFCTECGQKFEQTSQPAQPVQQSNQNSQYNQPAMSYSQMMSSNPVIKLIRQIGTSQLFFIAVILFSVSVLIQAINIFVPSADITSNLNTILSDYSDNGTTDFPVNEAMRTFSGLIALIGPVIICIGMWLQYTACKDTSGGIIKTSGLSMIRVMTIINFVLYCIILALAFLGSLILIASGSMIETTMTDMFGETINYGGMNFDISGMMGIIGVAFVIAVIIVGIFLILYFVKLISTIKSILTTASTGKPETKISMFVIVINFIIAFLLVLSLIGGSGLISVISSLINAAFLIVISIALVSYRSKIKMLDYQLKNSGNIPQ